MTPSSEFELGMKHGELLGEIIIVLLIVSGGGSAIVGAIKTYKVIDLFAKTYKRINQSPVQLFNDAVDASLDAF